MIFSTKFSNAENSQPPILVMSTLSITWGRSHLYLSELKQTHLNILCTPHLFLLCIFGKGHFKLSRIFLSNKQKAKDPCSFKNWVKKKSVLKFFITSPFLISEMSENVRRPVVPSAYLVCHSLIFSSKIVLFSFLILTLLFQLFPGQFRDF